MHNKQTGSCIMTVSHFKHRKVSEAGRPATGQCPAFSCPLHCFFGGDPSDDCWYEISDVISLSLSLIRLEHHASASRRTHPFRFLRPSAAHGRAALLLQRYTIRGFNKKRKEKFNHGCVFHTIELLLRCAVHFLGNIRN